MAPCIATVPFPSGVRHGVCRFGASGDAMQEDESSKAAMQFAMGQMTGNLTSLINKGRTNLSAGTKKGSTDRPTSGPEKEEGEQETGTEQLPGA